MQSGESGKRLGDLIKKAIDDCEITTTEYEQILAMADADQHIDAQERNLLNQLQSMIGDSTIKKIPG